MSVLIRLAIHSLNVFTDLTGRLVSWLTLLMVFITVLVVILRYGLSIGSVALQESVTYLHATVFLLGAAYTLQRDGHVRVDIFYRSFSPEAKAWVDAIGGIVFLLPLCGFMLLVSWEFALDAWRIREASGNADGIPAVFLLKTTIPLMAITLALQGIAATLKNLLLLVEGDET